MNLKILRESAKISQADVAKILGITQSNYSRYELGTATPTLPNLLKLADFYNVTLDYLVGRPYSNDIGYYSSEDKETLITFLNLSKTDKEKVSAFMQGLNAGKNNKQ